MSVFSNIWYSIFDDVERGNLDYYLLKPINILFNYSTKRFDLIFHFPTLLFPIVILVIEFFYFDFSLVNILIYILSLLLSVIIMFSIFVILGSLSFWFTDARLLQYDIFYYLFDGASKYPVDIYPKKVLPVFTFLIPVGLLAYAPAYFLVFGFNLSIYMLLVLVTILFLAISLYMWKSGLKQYTSASS